jgi:predicted dehydrogenase
MSASTLGVGILGVSPVRGWAATAHIPALRALPNYEIRALSAHSPESARAAGEAFGVVRYFPTTSSCWPKQASMLSP